MKVTIKTSPDNYREDLKSLSSDKANCGVRIKIWEDRNCFLPSYLVSWESHMLGILLEVLYRNKGPQNDNEKHWNEEEQQEDAYKELLEDTK